MFYHSQNFYHFEKDRAIIECVTEKLIANAALDELKLIREEDLAAADVIPDTIQDKTSISVGWNGWK